MDELPDLERLSVADKDDLIRALFAQVRSLTGQVAELKAKVTECEGRLALNSRNSSKPPSTDGMNKPKPKSQRQVGQHPTGGQEGHDGHTLKKVDRPDHTERHRPPAHCDACHRPLEGGTVVETRQVFDIPPLYGEVTEHQVTAIRCACGKICRGEFPEGVSAPVQYGPRIKAAVVHLTHHHMMPVARTGALMGDLFGLPMSDASVLAASEEARTRLAATVVAIGSALQAAPVAHADETGMRVAGKLHWMHVLATATLTWIGCHPNRGKKAFEAFGLLAGFLGTLIHDGWKPYRDLLCQHGLCNAHHLRELTYLFEEMGQAWAKRLIDLLVEVCREVTAAGEPVLHGDNGSTLKATTVLAMLHWLGVKPSYSRPRVSDDNAYAEALFRTAKYRPEFPAKGFATIDVARLWGSDFVRWYNTEHRHGGIRYVTPEQRHAGDDHAILASRHTLYQAARENHPKRWSRKTRNWSPIGAVTLNPERDEIVSAATASAESMRLAT